VVRRIIWSSLEGAAFSTLDLRASRDLKFGATTPAAHTGTLGFDAFNVLTRVNDGSFAGTLRSPRFGLAVPARAARQLQFSGRVEF
jgi:hypothetical protein